MEDNERSPKSKNDNESSHLINKDSESSHLINKDKSIYQNFADSFKKLIELPFDIWLTFISTSLSVFSADCALYTVFIYFIEIWDLSDTDVGLISTVLSISFFIFSYFVGSIVDYTGVKNTNFLASILLIFAFSIVAFVPVLALQIIIFAVIFNIGSCLLYTGTSISCALLSTPETVSLVFSFYMSFRFLGSAIFGLIYQIVASTIGENEAGFTTLFCICIGTQFIIIGLTFSLDSKLLEKQKIEDSGKILYMTGVLRSFKIAVRTKRLWRCLVLYIVISIPFSVFFQCVTSLPIYIEREIGGDSIYG